MRGRPPKLHLSKSLRIWADGDSCPAAARQTLFDAANRRHITLTLVCTKPRDWPHSAFIRSIVVADGGVSQRLLQLATDGDIVVSIDKQVLSQLNGKKIMALRPDEQKFAGGLDSALTAVERETAARLATLQKRKPDEAAAEGGAD